VNLQMDDLARAPSYLVRQRIPRRKEENPQPISPLVRPLPPRPLRD
jgi:hypothetical protein